MAACWAIGSFSFMLALVSTSRPSAVGNCVPEKKMTSCLTPSSNTENASWGRPLTKRPSRSVTVTLSDTTSTPARNVG